MSLHSGNESKKQLNQNSRIAVEEPRVTTEAATPLRRPSNENSPQPALSSSRKRNGNNAILTSATAQSSGGAKSQSRDQTPAYEKTPNTAAYAGFNSGFNSNFNDKLLTPTSANANTNNAICAQHHLDARDCDRERNQGEEGALKDGTKTTAIRKSNRVESIHSQLGGRGRDIS
ncbi:hypothetical protein NUW58_g1670 [Xylaria curta]|uniref:Uncharacterized protein n=2 Tax=Xylaria curta TaxID=42375 RepID=A0ACC1P217_9PEZI|nr:hypothetical protein NUW58_g5450 [Xylaria curta]KAJ2993998.1 hypothetical protein NUW58_g1670 [Xylaria curta]